MWSVTLILFEIHIKRNLLERLTVNGKLEGYSVSSNIPLSLLFSEIECLHNAVGFHQT